MGNAFSVTEATAYAGLDSTWGGDSADAYDSLANVDDFITNEIFDHSDWESLTDAQKVAAIREATRDIDSLQFVGSRYYDSQTLEFPRALDNEPSWTEAGSDASLWTETHERMQRDVRAALAYQANWLARNDGRNSHAENQASGIKAYSETIGPLRESFQYGGAATQRLCSEAATKLASWREPRRVYRG